MKKQLTILVVAAAVVAFAGTAEARGRGKGPGMGHGMRGDGPGMMLGLGPCVVDSPVLGLSDDQKAALKAIREAGRDQARAAMEARRALGKELRDLIADPAATEKQIRAKADGMRAQAQAKHDARLDQVLKARQVLTPEQLGRLPEARAACRGQRGDGPRGDGPRGDCPCMGGRPGNGPQWMDD
ncbi:MAG TPA: Spy/CpxP family protein refolding chaperone [Myxococcota bacterium]|nr:Spy/CpxP family protein refolding chaperone [Myxococcota bacterium]